MTDVAGRTIRSGTALGRLAVLAARPAEEFCELCSAPLPEGHRHGFDLDRDELRCICQPCTLLFERDAAGQGHFVLVPERRERLATPPAAEDLGIPVGLAFMIPQRDGSVQARYPSPAGAMAWELDEGTWPRLVQRWPPLRQLRVPVEAFLVNTAREHREYWIAPIDDCYRLVATVREHWRGLSGGKDVWPAIDAFFAALSSPVRGRISVGS